MKYMKKFWLWDYKLPKNWKPKTDEAWVWYLERRINYGDLKGLKPEAVKKYFDRLKLDPGRRLMIESYFKYYGTD